MGSPNNVGNPITPPSDFCLKHSLADFREYFKLDEKSVLYNLYYLSHHYDVCRSPSISQVVWSGSRRKTVTLEEHTRHLLKKIENIYLPDIWERWSEDDDDEGMGRHGRTLEDVAERELKDQKFYDDIFLKVKAFFGTDLAKMLGDKIAFLSADSIRDFVMTRLLPVDGDLVVKFLKFIRCSWDRTRDPGLDRLGERILSHAPKAANGLDGLDIGADAETFRNNLQKLVIMIFEHNEALISYFFRRPKLQTRWPLLLQVSNFQWKSSRGLSTPGKLPRR